MSLSRKMSRSGAGATDVSPVVRLWILRILVLLNGHRSFVETDGFSSDRLAESLGLSKWLDLGDDDIDAKKVRAELRRLHQDSEKDAVDLAMPGYLSSNVQRLAGLSGLSEVDCRILEFAVLMKTENMLDEASDTLGRFNLTRLQSVVSAVLGLPLAMVSNALSDKGVLCRSGLITVDRSPSYLSGKLDLISDKFAEQVYSYETDPISLFRDTVILSPDAELNLGDYAHISPSLAVLVPYLKHAVQTGKHGVNILLYGVPGTGKSQLARVLAKEAGSELFQITSEDTDGDPISGERRLRAYRATQNFFGQRSVMLAFDEAEDVFNDGDIKYGRRSTAQTRKAWMNRVLEGNLVPTLWISNSVRCLDPAFVRRFDMVVELPIPPKSQRARIIQASGEGLLDEGTVRRMAESTNLAPAVVASAVEVVGSLQGLLNEQEACDAVELLVNATLDAQGHAPVARRFDPNSLPETYDPAFVCADVDLVQVAEGLRCNGAGRLCLYGPPGTGKTAYGRWLADQLGKPLLVKRGSDLISMWVGGTEKNIAEAFQEAVREGAVLLIDEVDSFLQDRRGARHSWEVTGVNEMLTQMESFDGVFVASTNLMDNLDQAALRRFDLKARFDFLREDQACDLLARYCESLGVPKADAAARHELSHLGNLTPGDFAAVARQHRFLPFAKAQDLVVALRAESAVKEGVPRQMGFV